MWNTPRKLSPKKANLKTQLHLMRVTVQVRSLGELTSDGKPELEARARVVLNDLTPKGIHMFCDQALVAGQEIAIVIPAPTKIYLHGRVKHCQEREVLTPVISDSAFNFRVSLQFEYADEREADAAAKYCKEIQRQLTVLDAPPPKADDPT